MKKTLLWLLVITVILSFVITFSAVGCKQEEAAAEEETAEEEAAPAEETAEEEVAEEEAPAMDLTFGYISKLLTHPWFMAESAGIEKFCDENGIEYIALDANMDDEKCLEMVDQLINQGIDALMICATSQGIGPAIMQKCEDAGIPVVTIDDTLMDQNDMAFPHVGMPTKEVGMTGGEALAAMATERGFFEDGNVVKVGNLTAAKLSVLMERTEGYTEAIAANTPLVDPDDFILVETEDGMMNNALPAANAIISANPDVTHWIFTGINDDCGIAAVRSAEELGVENFISCGLGGYDLALEELAKGNDKFITIGLRPDNEGYAAAEELYMFLTAGTALQETIYVGGTIVNVDNYTESPFWAE